MGAGESALPDARGHGRAGKRRAGPQWTLHAGATAGRCPQAGLTPGSRPLRVVPRPAPERVPDPAPEREPERPAEPVREPEKVPA